MKTLLLALALIIPTTAAAQSVAPKQRFADYGRVINAVALDAASSTFSINISNAPSMGIWGLMTVWASVTDADNSVTAITMVCTGSRDGGTTDFTMQDCTTASGVCTSSNASWVKDPSGMTSKKWAWRIDVEALPQIECTFTDTGGAAADSLSVWVSFATKG